MKPIKVLITIHHGLIEAACEEPIELHVIDKDNASVGEEAYRMESVEVKSEAEILSEIEKAKDWDKEEAT